MTSRESAARPSSVPAALPGLPPPPDPVSGQPLPPDDPAFPGTTKRQLRIVWPLPRPRPPEGLSPVLAWRTEGVRAKLGTLLIATVLACIGISVIALFYGDPWYSGFLVWPVDLVGIVFVLLVTRPFSYDYWVAGADWFQWGHKRLLLFWRPATSHHFRMYELRKIEAYYLGVNGPFIRLEDTEGNGYDGLLIMLQQDRNVWNLLYNGIRYSMILGATMNTTAIRLLHLANQENSSAMRHQEELQKRTQQANGEPQITPEN